MQDIYKRLRENGKTAQVALTEARTHFAAQVKAYEIKPRYVHITYNPATPDGLRWIENISGGLRFVRFADEISERGIQHKGWFTNEFQDEVLRGAVYRLPHGKFLAGYTDPNNEDCARISMRIYNDELNAAYAADKIAEKTAESEREYNEAWQAGSDYQQAGIDLKTERKDTLDYIAALREAVPHAGAVTDKAKDTICSVLRGKIKSCLRDMEKLRAKRAEIWNEYEHLRAPSQHWRAHLWTAFSEGAGLC